MATIINRTPHPITVLSRDGKVLKIIESDGLPPIRLKSETLPVGEIDGICVTKTTFGEPENLPKETDDIFYIVSQLVKSACPHRKDLLVPAEVIRNRDGNIIGCMSFGV